MAAPQLAFVPATPSLFSSSSRPRLAHARPPSNPTPRRTTPTCQAIPSRRLILQQAIAALGLAALPLPIQPAAASGLILFPLREALSNSYIFMRAPETVSLASENVFRTNPVEKTSLRLHSLTKRGVDRTLRVSDALAADYGLGPTTWIWASQATSAQETAHIIGASLRVRSEQIVPEFSFLDARGVGAMEGTPIASTAKILRDMDRNDVNARMPPGEGLYFLPFNTYLLLFTIPFVCSTPADIFCSICPSTVRWYAQ